ncbi:hypothetical protein GCM10023321_13580 [Pseudonocardia eucalypti]|uniref:Uncharacterized protein n=1 Tax=Pseudonocardia eucalypti TaxID=648755 RepID=A0ABP9PNI4_9PSEU|nr:hypothetical protein [Pseudonocardia eucalypti]
MTEPLVVVEGDAVVPAVATGGAAEGVAAFREKRRSTFPDRDGAAW